jgi:hypothetical protein
MDMERYRIDPEGRYAISGLRQAEYGAQLVLEVLPCAHLERTRDVIQIDEIAEDGLVVILTREALELRLPTVEWTHPHCPARSSRLWKRVQWEGMGKEKLAELIAAARKARSRQYRKCNYCSERTPPEHMHAKDVCHGCAEEHLGVIH